MFVEDEETKAEITLPHDEPLLPKELNKKIKDLLVTARSAVLIKSKEDCEYAIGLLATLHKTKKEVENFFNPLVRKAHESWRALTTTRGHLTGPLEEAITLVSQHVAQWVEEQKEVRKALAEQTASAGGAPVAIPEPKFKGVSIRKNTYAEVIDKKMLVKAIANELAPLELVEINTSALNAMARALGPSLNIPGVRVYSRATTVVSLKDEK